MDKSILQQIQEQLLHLEELVDRVNKRLKDLNDSHLLPENITKDLNRKKDN
jgi:hypothetical protein